MKFISMVFAAFAAAPACLSPVIARGQGPADYSRIADRFRQYYNAGQGDSLFALFSPEVKQALPIDKTAQLLRTLHGQLGKWNSLDPTLQRKHYTLFKAGFDHSVVTLNLALDSNGKINGFHFLPYQPDTSSGTAKFEGAPLTLSTASGTLYGSLVLPPGKTRMPLVLIIAGSGPTDRDGNSPALGLRSDMYRILADSLALHGIASFRYDKRGIGASAAAMKSESDVTIDDYMRDAAGWIRLLRADHRFSKIVVMGHSEGSLIGMVAAREGSADAYISAAGAGDRIDKVLLPQLAAQSPALADSARILLDSLTKGQRVHVAGGPLNLLFRPSVQPFMISWLRYDPRAEIRKLTIPVLILQGSTDLQVTVADAEKLAGARPSAVLKIIPGMNHIFRKSTSDRQENLATYNNRALPLDPLLVRDIVAFVDR